MGKLRLIALSFLVVCATALLGFAGTQSSGQIDRKQLRSMLEQLGYEVKDIVTDPGKEKYSVKMTREGLDIPIGCEISPSSAYIWLTVNLGNAPTEASPKCFALLKQNSKIQPSQFYVTDSGRMMVASPVENKGITNAVIRQRIDGLADTVGKTKDIWQK